MDMSAPETLIEFLPIRRGNRGYTTFAAGEFDPNHGFNLDYRPIIMILKKSWARGT